MLLDLIRQLAAASGDGVPDDPERWYMEAFGAAPDYSEILKRLGGTPAERQALLRRYFEPSDDERTRGLKAPTNAHRAIARMCAAGYIRVLLTTNFDPLLELALEEAGVHPQVITSADGAKGALPLAHSACTVVKVHGDYRDTRIRNTVEELSAYEPALDALLDQIFDEYGLVISGWSGQYDEALRGAILRAPNRRFSTYIGVLDEPSEHIVRLAQHRDAFVVQGLSADQLFEGLVERLQSLRDLEATDRISDDMAIATLKRLLADLQGRIRLHDFLSDETERLVARLLNQEFMESPTPTPESIRERILRYDAVVARLERLFAVSGYWAEDDQVDLLTSCLQRIANARPDAAGLVVWNHMRLYPALRLFYAAGLGALAGNKHSTLKALSDVRVKDLNEERPAFWALTAVRVVAQDAGRALAGYETRKTPINDHVFATLRQAERQFLADDQQYENAFDSFEMLLSLRAVATDDSSGRFLPGRYMWNHGSGRASPLEAFERELRELGPEWWAVKSGMLPQGALESLAAQLRETMARESF